MNTSPLSKLLVSESQSLDEQKLADFLSSYLTINNETHKFDFNDLFINQLSNTLKIQILLMAFKARAVVLGLDNKATPSEIISMDIMPEGSVKSTLKKLLEEGEIKAEKGKYYIPNYKISKVIIEQNKI